MARICNPCRSHKIPIESIKIAFVGKITIQSYMSSLQDENLNKKILLPIFSPYGTNEFRGTKFQAPNSKPKLMIFKLNNHQLSNPQLTNQPINEPGINESRINDSQLTILESTNPELTILELTNSELTNPESTNPELTNPN